ncbi:hypothetical protein CHCC14820_3699 [Bacillus paralicheniformis]|nr:hypothetical protein CHCC14820_3699 [Bacillus paralicheniformis]
MKKEIKLFIFQFVIHKRQEDEHDDCSKQESLWTLSFVF